MAFVHRSADGEDAYHARVVRGARGATAVVCAAFDPATDAAVRALRGRLAGVSRRLQAPPLHRPHVTLGAARLPPGPDATEGLDAVHALAATVAAAHARFPLELGHLGLFPPGVLWLAPAPSAPLAALQVAVDDALAAAGHARAFATTEPAGWVAHCTLGTGLRPAELGAAVTRLAPGWRPVRGRVDRLVTLLVGRPDEQEALLGGGAVSPAGAGGG